jgi:hypothetical protein
MRPSALHPLCTSGVAVLRSTCATVSRVAGTSTRGQERNHGVCSIDSATCSLCRLPDCAVARNTAPRGSHQVLICKETRSLCRHGWYGRGRSPRRRAPARGGRTPRHACNGLYTATVERHDNRNCGVLRRVYRGHGQYGRVGAGGCAQRPVQSQRRARTCRGSGATAVGFPTPSRPHPKRLQFPHFHQRQHSPTSPRRTPRSHPQFDTSNGKAYAMMSGGNIMVMDTTVATPTWAAVSWAALRSLIPTTVRGGAVRGLHAQAGTKAGMLPEQRTCCCVSGGAG